MKENYLYLVSIKSSDCYKLKMSKKKIIDYEITWICFISVYWDLLFMCK